MDSELNTGTRVLKRDKRTRRKKVYSKTNGKCYYCGCILHLCSNGRTRMTIDHLIPKCNGGSDDIANLVPACKICNCKKGDKNPDEFIKSNKE